MAAPERVGHYRILGSLGGGGMGLVYRAEDIRLGRTVALKLLPPELLRDPVAKARFFQEARTASTLEHPNLCTLYDAGETEDGRLWLAMPCYDGETLRDRLEDGPLPIDEAVDVARQTALGLAKAHRLGIVHRDIKPANLMLTGDGVVKIVDFGIAKLAGEAGLTQVGMTIGTPGYMSPEQALGRAVDHRTDLWALGAVLYEMLAGRQPFRGDQVAVVMEGILRREPEPLAKSRPEVPAQLEEIVRRLLVKDPEGRYATAEEVAADLRALAGPGSASISPAGRRPWALWTGAALALGLLLAGGWWLGPWRGRAGSFPPTVDRLTLQEGIELFPNLSPAGDFLVYAREDGGDLDLFLQRVGGQQPINLTPDSPADDTQPAFSPDGTRIVFRSEREGGGLFLMGATGESVRRLTGFGYNPTWGPDGRQIACATQPVRDPLSRQKRSEIWRIDLGTLRRERVAGQDGVQPSWSPDGRRIAYWGLARGTSRRQIWTVAAEGGEPVLAIDDGKVDWNPVWAPDGQSLYFVSNRTGSMNLWRVAVDPGTGQRRGPPEPVTIPASWSGFPSFSRDGRRLLYATYEQKTTIERAELDPAGPEVRGEPVPVTRDVPEISYFSVSPDGAWLALSSWGQREELFVIRPDGSGLRQLTEDPAKDRIPVWLPDGRILFASDRSGRYEAWSIHADGSGLRPLTSTRGEPVNHPIASPDGRRLAFGLGFTGGALLDLALPLERRTPRRLPPLAPGASFFPHSWSRDGRRLAGYSNQGLFVFSFATGRYEKLAPEGDVPVWMNDQQRILCFDGNREIRMLDPRTGESRLLLAPPAGSRYGAFDLSPDNRWLYLLRVTEEGDLWLQEEI